MFLLYVLCGVGLLCLGLLPMKAVRLKLGELLAADPTTLAPAVTANEIALYIATVNVNEDLVIGDLTLATFTGSAPKVGATGPQQAGINPITGQQIITILVPAGGYRFECTVAPATPQTVFGFALTDTGGTTLLAAQALTTPVVITNVGDFVDLGAVTMALVAQPIS